MPLPFHGPTVSVHHVQPGALLGVSSRSTAARFSSSWATEETPAGGTTGSSPPICQASTTWLTVAPVSRATSRSTVSRAGVPGWSNSAGMRAGRV